jgi:hypothetical protein
MKSRLNQAALLQPERAFAGKQACPIHQFQWLVDNAFNVVGVIGCNTCSMPEGCLPDTSGCPAARENAPHRRNRGGLRH